MIYPNKKPRRAAGRKQLKRETYLSRSLARIPYLRQVKTQFIDKDVIKRQREKEKPVVYLAQLERVRKQIRAFHVFGDVGRWPEVSANE